MCQPDITIHNQNVFISKSMNKKQNILSFKNNINALQHLLIVARPRLAVFPYLKESYILAYMPLIIECFHPLAKMGGKV